MTFHTPPKTKLKIHWTHVTDFVQNFGKFKDCLLLSATAFTADLCFSYLHTNRTPKAIDVAGDISMFKITTSQNTFSSSLAAYALKKSLKYDWQVFLSGRDISFRRLAMTKSKPVMVVTSQSSACSSWLALAPKREPSMSPSFCVTSCHHKIK